VVAMLPSVIVAGVAETVRAKAPLTTLPAALVMVHV